MMPISCVLDLYLKQGDTERDGTMPSFKHLFVLATICVGSFSLPASDVTIESTSSSVLLVSAKAASICQLLPFEWSGYYWCTNSNSAIFTNGGGGKYSIQWSGDGWFIGGKGWLPGSTSRQVTRSISVINLVSDSHFLG